MSGQGRQLPPASSSGEVLHIPRVPFTTLQQERNPTPPYLQGFCCLLYYSLTLKMQFSCAQNKILGLGMATPQPWGGMEGHRLLVTPSAPGLMLPLHLGLH